MPHLLEFQVKTLYSATALGIALPVRLMFNETQVEFPAKLDTGADICVFARAYGESLGVPIDSGERQLVATLTGTFVAYAHDLEIEVCGLRFDCRICFYEDEHLRRNVLGRTWLQRCRVAIVEHDATLYLSRYDS